MNKVSSDQDIPFFTRNSSAELLTFPNHAHFRFLTKHTIVLGHPAKKGSAQEQASRPPQVILFLQAEYVLRKYVLASLKKNYFMIQNDCRELIFCYFFLSS